MRRLLMEWEKYARDMTEAGVIAYPTLLGGKTVGLLDATS
jgi:hypothetical protein